MEHALKLLSMAAGLVLTCLVIGFGMLTYRESREFGNAVLKSVRDMTTEYGESVWTRYDGCLVNGGEVISCIRKYQEELPVLVVQGGQTYRYEGDFVLAENRPETAGYIRIADIYEGRVLRDGTDKVSSLKFTRKR